MSVYMYVSMSICQRINHGLFARNVTLNRAHYCEVMSSYDVQ
jgi:hypothetical protein